MYTCKWNLDLWLCTLIDTQTHKQIYNNNKSARNRIWSHKVDTGVHKSTHILQKKNYYFYLMDTSEIQYTMPHQVSLSNKSVCMSAISCPISLAMHSVVFVLWLGKAVSRKSHQILFDPWCENSDQQTCSVTSYNGRNGRYISIDLCFFYAHQLILILHSHKKPGIDLMHWRHVSITTTPCWGSRLVALRARVVLAERIGAQPLSQCAGPG